ncbi:TonB-dependent receptor [Polaribacter haliotis]|uniref:TonB-dependent receptor n=1 Tax=Polaribacter haliotis TaxID=1888915 RepID=A0A7L8AEX1_9FLAO|nr:outer membrane beta-barrel family protein [Polaribacter haliotis]QOD60555.1 TonB-dependent receptor [Polaribacter haliotis]
MKKRIAFLLLFCSLTIFSQKNDTKLGVGILSGKILDNKTKQPFPYVNIICKNFKQEIVSGGISDKNGKFNIKKLPLDSLFIDIQFIGYKSIKKKIKFSKENSAFNLNTIFLEEDTTQLKAIEVVSETSSMVQKIDRKVFNVGKDLASAGTNSLQMLENIPSVQVDYQSGNINLRGNQNVRVLINGKPSNLPASQLLKQLPSSAVKSVEIITNPSAKYSPEGMSGIINFVLKKNVTIGFNGSFSAGLEHSINTRPTASLDLNYRSGKFNFYGSYYLDWGDFETFSNFERLDKNLNQDINFLDNTTSHYIKSGVDYYINKKNTLSFHITKSIADTDFHVDTRTLLNNNLIFDARNISVFDIQETSYNLDYKIDFNDEGENLELEINYSKNTNPQEDNNNEIINPNSKVYNYSNSIKNNNDIFLVNLDYTKPIKNGTLELGLETRIQNAFNKIITNQEVETNGNPPTKPKGNSNFTYDRDLYSAYINLNKEYEKFSFQAGLRLEQFKVDGLFSNTEQTNLEPYSDEIFSIYPSAFVTYASSDKHQFQIGYSRRVDRPGIDQVTPIQEWNTPLSISVGNRNLKPQFTNSFEFNYTNSFKKGYFTLGTFYRETKDIIGRIFDIDNTNADRQILSYTNYNSSKSYGFEFASSIKMTNWWTLRPSFNSYIQENQGLVNNNFIQVENVLTTARISNSFKASKKLRFQLSSSYRGTYKNVLVKVEPYLLVNASARYSILKGKGSLSLRATDIFDNYKLDFSTTNPFPQNGQFTLEYSSIYLGFSYNFGGGKNRERDRKYRENNETESSGGIL